MRLYAIGVALVTLAAIATGAMVAKVHGVAPFVPEIIHVGASVVAAALLLGLAIGSVFARETALRIPALIALTACAMEAIPGSPIFHALLAPIVMAGVAATAFFPSSGPDSAEAPIPKQENALHYSVISLPPLVLMQIALGAAYRHKLMGVMSHMGGALLVSGVALVVCTILLQRFPDHGTLRPRAVALISIVMLQILLGIVVFIMRLVDMDPTLILAVAAAAHVCNGALTLAATTVLALDYQRSAVTAVTTD